MDVCIVTGSAGLIGAEAARFFSAKMQKVIGIDNDMRRYFFGPEGSTAWSKEALQSGIPNYLHKDLDIRNVESLTRVFEEYSCDIKLIIHAAAQPSHDWAAREPLTDFGINATGTLNLLEMARQFCPDAVFIFTSTNKVYGDRPNAMPLIESATRWDLPPEHQYYEGIDEAMPIDQSKHSLFGASKAAADLLVQEYGRYFGMNTVCFRGGCLTGPNHAGTALHGFLSYLMKCAVTGEPYTIIGYKGKQVRDNIHSRDLITAFDAFYRAPRAGEVYNIGGGRENACSILEAIGMCERIAGRPVKRGYEEQPRSGDHQWYISSLKKFRAHFPDWKQEYTLEGTLNQIHEVSAPRWA